MSNSLKVGRSPWIVSVWGDAEHEPATWNRETFSDAMSDVSEFARLAVANDRPVLISIRDRGGVLIHQVATTGYTPALQVMPGVPS